MLAFFYNSAGVKKLTAGRPKLEIERKKQLNVRLSEQEFKDLEFVMEKYKLNKVDAIVKAIKMLKDYKPKRYKVIKDKDIQTEGCVMGEVVMFDKPRKPKSVTKKISL